MAEHERTVAGASQSEVDDLRRMVGDLMARVDGLERENASLRAAPTDAPPAQEPSDRRVREVSRRGLLLGGAGAAAAGVALVAGSTPAAATNGQAIIQGQNNSGTNTTPIYSSGGDHSYAMFVAGEQGGIYANAYGQTSGYSVSQSAGLLGDNSAGYGVVGFSKYSTAGLFHSRDLFGVYGESDNLAGVVGKSATDRGVWGWCPNGTGVVGETTFGTAVRGICVGAYSSTNAVHGVQQGIGVAGRFEVTSSSNSTAALYGVTAGSGQGVKGNATAGATGVVGTSSGGLGGQFSGSRAALNIVPTKATGRPTTGSHGRGDVVVDANGALFLCTAAGTPGTWVKVTVTAA